MVARNKSDSARIDRIIKKHFMDYPGDWQYLVDLIAKQMNEPPMSVEAIQKRYKRVLNHISEGSEIRLSEDENLRKFKESLGFFEGQRTKALEEERRASSMRDFVTYTDKVSGEMKILTDGSGHPIIDPAAFKVRQSAIKAAFYRAKDCQYFYDKLLLDTGNRVPKTEKDPDVQNNYYITITNVLVQGFLREAFTLCDRLNAPKSVREQVTRNVEALMIHAGDVKGGK